jgi:hypothetical protein
MGGNALKHLHPVRLTSSEVSELVHHLHRNWQLMQPRPLYLVPWVAEKQDHGDIDVICEASIESVLQFTDFIGVDRAIIKRNDKVLSTPVVLPWDATAASPRICQVDFICCSSDEAVTTRFFYAGGDFGMLLGRVAAWHGLVFGMDGLRYRAERGVDWQSDVHLTADPAQILSVLGYILPLPWFDTYDRLWRYILSSPMAGAWMFMPEATNHENRSRDLQRRKVGDFQAWLTKNFPHDLVASVPRRSAVEAQAWVRQQFPDIPIDVILQRQKAQRIYEKLRTRLLGIGAVEDVIGTGHAPEIVGEIVRHMQPLLPSKSERDHAMADPQKWSELITLARSVATTIAKNQGLTVHAPPAIPLYVAPP